MTRQFIDIHILQTVPPSNLNRDDTGSPKTAYYGGVRRSRVSSQSWKRATRKSFDDVLAKDKLGVRTKHVVALVADRIKAKASDLAGAEDHAGLALKAAGITLAKPRVRKDAPADAPEPVEQSGYLLFLSSSQIDQLADLAIAAARNGGKVDAKKARAAADSNHSVDVSLFGRMVADATDLNVDAAAQVAHALSVHAVENEFDYFTAVDDRAPEDNAGAGMIGTVEFNSATLYRYATINVEALRSNLGDATATVEAVRAFIKRSPPACPPASRTRSRTEPCPMPSSSPSASISRSTWWEPSKTLSRPPPTRPGSAWLLLGLLIMSTRSTPPMETVGERASSSGWARRLLR